MLEGGDPTISLPPSTPLLWLDFRSKLISENHTFFSELSHQIVQNNKIQGNLSPHAPKSAPLPPLELGMDISASF